LTSRGNAVALATTLLKEHVRNEDATAALVYPPDAFTDTSMGLSMKFYYDTKNEIEMR